jgi:hypothetical protein
VKLRIRIPPASQRVIDDVGTLRRRILEAVARGFNKANAETVKHIQSKRLSGKGPFPVPQHRLGVVTGRLRASLRLERARVTGTRVDGGAITTDVPYAAVHEFGYNSSISVGGYTRRIAGRLSRVGRHTRLRAGASRKVNFPARAPIGTGIAERETATARVIEQEINREVNR